MKVAICLYGKYTDWFLKNNYNADLFAFSLDDIPDPNLFVNSRKLTQPISEMIPNLNSSPQSARRVMIYDYCAQQLAEMVQVSGVKYDVMIYTTFSHIIMVFPTQPGIYYTKYYSFHSFHSFPPLVDSFEIISHTHVRINGSSVIPIYALEEFQITALFRILFKNKVRLISDFRKGTDTQPRDINPKFETTFLIPSVINVSRIPFDYSNYRSIFTPNERHKQTIAQVQSLENIPNSESYLLEGSPLNLLQLEELHYHTNVILFCKDEHGFLYANKHPNKSIYEIYVMREMLNWVKSDWYFKFGGRYSLLKYFDITQFQKDLPVVKTIDAPYTFGKQDIIECIMYSFPNGKKEHFKKIYDIIMNVVQTTSEGIETLLFKHIGSFERADMLNVFGRDAIESFDRIV